MWDRGAGATRPVWHKEIDTLFQGGTAGALQRYAIFRQPKIPGRVSAQMWILALATAGLLLLFPLFVTNILITLMASEPPDIERNWQSGETVDLAGSGIHVPPHLVDHMSREQKGNRLVFGLTLGAIVDNLPVVSRPSVSASDRRQHITFTLFRSNQPILGLDRFFRLYEAHLDAAGSPDRTGLTARAFQSGGPFDNEVLLYETGYSQDRYFVRCFAGARGARISTCFRERPLSREIGLRYSFDRALIGNWVGLEAAILTLADRMIAGRDPIQR